MKEWRFGWKIMKLITLYNELEIHLFHIVDIH